MPPNWAKGRGNFRLDVVAWLAHKKLPLHWKAANKDWTIDVPGRLDRSRPGSFLCVAFTLANKGHLFPFSRPAAAIDISRDPPNGIKPIPTKGLLTIFQRFLSLAFEQNGDICIGYRFITFLSFRPQPADKFVGYVPKPSERVLWTLSAVLCSAISQLLQHRRKNSSFLFSTNIGLINMLDSPMRSFAYEWSMWSSSFTARLCTSGAASGAAF